MNYATRELIRKEIDRLELVINDARNNKFQPEATKEKYISQLIAVLLQLQEDLINNR